jgi:glycosyltransferase involved in cell wall biosynthesis
MIEAMACGTPVIAWDEGSVREIVDPGVTGFIVRSVDEAAAAVGRIDGLDRGRVRATFERRFSVATMTRKYVDLYSSLSVPESGVKLRREGTNLAVDGPIRA